MSALREGWGRGHRGGARAVVWLFIAALTLLFVACGDDTPSEAAHDVDEHGGGTSLLVVKSAEKGAPLPETLAEQLRSFEHVVEVEGYIRLRMEGFDVVGVEPAAPMRIMTGQPDVHLIEAELSDGAVLRAGDADKDVVLAGELLAQESGVETGAAFRLADPEYALTVGGTFSTEPASLSRALIMPLALVQKIYGKEGQVTHFWVTVDSTENSHDVIRAVQLALGESVQVQARTHS